MPVGAPKDISECRRFFAEPRHPRRRLCGALRAYFLQGQAPKQVARAFGYSVGYFHVLCHHFWDPDSAFFSFLPAPVPAPSLKTLRRASS